MIQVKSAIKEGEWPKCAAPRLVYSSALFFETCMHVCVRTTFDQIYSAKVPFGNIRLYITILHWPCSSFLIVLVAKALATSYDIIFNSLNCTPTCSVAMLVLAKFIVFVAVASRGEDVMPDEICRRFNGNQQ